MTTSPLVEDAAQGLASRRRRWVVIATAVVPLAAAAPTHELTTIMFVLAPALRRWRTNV
jgi:hypothetical protein